MVKDGEIEIRIRKFEEEAPGMAHDESSLSEESIAQSLDGEAEPAFRQAKDLEGLSKGISEKSSLEVSGAGEKFFAGDFGSAESIFKFADGFLIRATAVVEIKDVFG